jgi:hypothetical protein
MDIIVRLGLNEEQVDLLMDTLQDRRARLIALIGQYPDSSTVQNWSRRILLIDATMKEITEAYQKGVGS